MISLIKKGFKALKSMIKKGLVRRVRTTPYDGQSSYMETTSRYESIYPYGMYAKAPVDSLVLLQNLNADESNKVGFEFDNKTIIDVEEGEVILFNPAQQQFVKFKSDGSIEIEAKSDLNITATTSHTGNVSITGNLNVTGNITATGTVSGATISSSGAITATGAISGGSVSAGNGASGTMLASSPTGSITVTSGIITTLVP